MKVGIYVEMLLTRAFVEVRSSLVVLRILVEQETETEKEKKFKKLT